MDEYKTNYKTVENSIEAYGGYLEAVDFTIDDFGAIALSFNRDVIYDEDLVADFMPDYEQKDIEVAPTQDEINALTADFKANYNVRRLLSSSGATSDLWDRNVNSTKSIEDRIIVKLNEHEVFDETDEAKYNFTVSVTQLSTDKINLQVDFANPSLIG